MNFWVLLQVLLNIVFLGVLALVWIRLNRPQKDDPRMSRGLQLLQSKIAVLEDLSDRTEVQVNQLTSLLENKCRDIQNKIFDAEEHIDRIDQSIQKSMEVARIFQDKIPHKEIIERQNTVKFVKAAKLAHQGYSPDQIAAQVELSRGEIEFITKMNKDRLMISEEELPEWAKESDKVQEDKDQEESEFTSHSFRDLTSIFEVPKTDHQSLKKLGDEFRKACRTELTERVDTQEPLTPVETGGETREALDFLESDTVELETADEASEEKVPGVINETAPQQKAEKSSRTIIEKEKLTDSARTLSPKIEPNRPAKGSALERDISIRPVEFRRVDLSKDLG